MTAEAPPRVLELCQRFMRLFGQTVKLISLYKTGHPVPSSSLQESWHLLHELFTESGWTEATFALVGGRWLVNENKLADSAHTFELLSIVFRCHALQSLTFRTECRLYEFSALCELAATPPNKAYRTDAADFLKERGVRNVTVNIEEFVRSSRVRLPASAMVQNPLAGVSLRAGKPPAASPRRAEGDQGFGAFLKSLVETAVSDPRERARIYSDTVRHVEQALAQHVSEATHRLLLEKQGVLNERIRSESVISAVGEGKVVVDQEGRVLMMDPAAEEIVGRPFAEVAGKQILESLDTGERFLTLAKDLVLPENRPVSEDIQTAGGAEALEAFRRSVAVVHDEQGRVVGTYAVLPHAAKYREAQKIEEEFIANVTHDLKAPLASIVSALELLSDKVGARLDGDEADFLDISMRNCRTLRQLIDELLDFSKMRNGKMSVRPKPQALAPLLEDCARALTPWADSKGLRLEIVDPAALKGLPDILADRGRALQLLNNLISNAIKFTPEGGRIALSAAPGEGERRGFMVVRVQDTGCGIPLADQKRIFDRFAQGEPGTREGVGLGLAIAREIAGLHGGQLWFESEVGKGSSFYFSLPIARSNAAVA